MTATSIKEGTARHAGGLPESTAARLVSDTVHSRTTWKAAQAGGGLISIHATRNRVARRNLCDVLDSCQKWLLACGVGQWLSLGSVVSWAGGSL